MLSETSRLATDQSPGILQHIDELSNRVRGITTVLAASLALSAVGTAVESLIDAAEANAQAPAAHASKRHPKLIQEYVTVNGGGTHTFLEKCKDSGHQVKRQVAYKHPDQPLGKCDVGSSVIVTDKTTGALKRVAHTNSKNNHFVFNEEPAQTPAGGSANGGASAGGSEGGSTGGGGGGGETGDPYASGNVGVDVSWPQCGTADMTPSGYDFGVVGINAGLTYSVNPCLQTEADNFAGKQLKLYVNTAWNSESSHINPDSPIECAEGDENCLAYNYGYNAGVAAANAAIDVGISMNTEVFEDVEPDATWSTDTEQNQQSLLGEHDALIDNGATNVGIYSYTTAWNDITGGWQNGWDSWGFTSWTTASDAMSFCTGHRFTGGPSKMMQFTPDGSNLDHDVAC